MVTPLAEHAQKARQIGYKALTAYATTQALAKAAAAFADRHAHIWRIEQGYADETYWAANKFAAENHRLLPGARRRITTGDGSDNVEIFKQTDWTWLRGLSFPAQVRFVARGIIEFRTARARDLTAVQARVAEIEALEDERAIELDFDFEPTTRTDIYSWNKDEWDYRTRRTARTFDSVVLPKSTQEELEADLRRFTESRDRLTRLEMPWRRGYLLSGPPGTGKTSLSLAIAGALGFNLATMSLTDVKSDGSLRKAVAGLPARTVLVIEDIDAYAVSNERDHNAAKDGDLSLSGLLNSLDGFETPEGLVTILTTNHIEKLDPALVRSGRMDRTFTLDYIEAPELERLFVWFYEQQPPSSAPEITGATELTPAEVAELFKQHLDAPEAGWEAVLHRIETNTHKNLEVVA